MNPTASSLRFTGNKTSQYLAEQELVAAVNAALLLEMPLLLTGEPGTGKTSLAAAIAQELGLGEVLAFHTTFDAQARDVLYQYDQVLRFFHAQTRDEQARDASHYVRYQALGEAIRSGSRRVVLIDEIDKAPRDFPNSLLHELDTMAFTVRETGTDHRATLRPIVVITNNAEHELPDPFLRRCIFHHIAFPGEEQLRKILNLHLGHDKPMGRRLLTAGLDTVKLRQPDGAPLMAALVSRFSALRSTPALEKKPGTSEMLHWIELVLMEAWKPSPPNQSIPGTFGARLEALLSGVPFAGALAKRTGDLERLLSRASDWRPGLVR